MRNTQWFEVDKKGLAALVQRRGKSWIVCELIQNAWDTMAGEVVVNLEPSKRGYCTLEVIDDDPEGFADLSHAFTLFADSAKKSDPELRGRFNLGEKLVLALCREAEIHTTKGLVRFAKTGRHVLRNKPPRQRGSAFWAEVQMTAAERKQALADMRDLIPPAGVRTIINGAELEPRTPYKTIEAVLPTEVLGPEGVLRATTRKCEVEFHRVQGEVATLYEMGIPVVALGGDEPFHINVQQKVPLTMERDNVRPAFLRKVRALVLEHAFQAIEGDTAAAPWVTEALPRVPAEAVRHVVQERFGERAVIADPSDREGENIAKAEGYTVVHGGALPKDAWEAVRKAEALKPAGQVTPSPKPFSADGKALVFIPSEQWTSGMFAFAELVNRVIDATDHPRWVQVEFTADATWSCAGAYVCKRTKPDEDGLFVVNIGRLGKDFIDAQQRREDRIRLVIHELAHEYGHHLESGYHRALERIGACLVEVALGNPGYLRAAKGHAGHRP